MKSIKIGSTVEHPSKVTGRVTDLARTPKGIAVGWTDGINHFTHPLAVLRVVSF